MKMWCNNDIIRMMMKDFDDKVLIKSHLIQYNRTDAKLSTQSFQKGYMNGTTSSMLCMLFQGRKKKLIQNKNLSFKYLQKHFLLVSYLVREAMFYF